MTVKVEFADVLDLVPQSTVKVNDVSVGKVTAIDLEGYQALVTMQLRARRRAARQRGGRAPADQPAGREVRRAQRAREGASATSSTTAKSSRSSAPAATPRWRRCSAR